MAKVKALGQENLEITFGGDDYHAYCAGVCYQVTEEREEEL